MEALTVLDTDVFIDHFRGLAAATAYVEFHNRHLRGRPPRHWETLDKGAANQEQLTTIDRFLTRNAVTRLPVSVAASLRAVVLLQNYVLAHGLSIPDALIAAVVLEGAHTLVTSNVRHFRFITGLRLEPAPYRLPQPDLMP